MAALQPRTTLDGAPFQQEVVPSVKVGQTEADVRSLLGKPFQELTASDVTVWRYYERYTPRGCNPPMLTREFRVSFRGGVVVQVVADGPISSR